MSSEQTGRQTRPDDTDHGPPARMAPADQAGAPPPLLDQAFDGGSLYQLRASVAAHGGSAGMSRQRTDDLVVAVHELAANVVRHGSGRGRLLMWQHDDELLCRITDEGASETPKARGAGGRGGAWTDERGTSEEERHRPEAPASGGSAGSSPRAGTAGGSGGSSPRAGTAGGSGGSSPRANRDARAWRIQPGHGLWLVRKLADRVGVQPAQNGVATTITFSLRPPGPPVLFRLMRSTSPAGPVLALSGHLDLTSAAEFTEAVGELAANAQSERVILDLAGLALWDSFGLAALLRAQSHVGAALETQLVLRDVPEPLLNELRATGLSERFTFADGSEADGTEADGTEADGTEQAVAD